MFNRKGRKDITPPGVRSAVIYSVHINVLVYLLFLVIMIYGRGAVIPYEKELPQHPQHQMCAGMFFTGVVMTYIYVFILFCINFHILKQERYKIKTRNLLAIFISLVFIVMWNRGLMMLTEYMFDLPKPDARGLRGSMVRDIVLGSLVIFTSQISCLNYRRQLIAVEKETLKAEYERARYEALKAQINPHFLFNTLNTLNSMIGFDQKKAQEYLQKLSSIFRYTIQGKDATTLAEELAFTRDYCDLMQIRYGENIKFIFEISDKYNEYRLPPFSIQTLVENAIKHNVISKRSPLAITVSTGEDDTVTVFNLVNRKEEVEAGEGIGLVNLAERYRLKYGKEIEIRNSGEVFSVTLPLIKE